jgi:hypothetical protein
MMHGPINIRITKVVLKANTYSFVVLNKRAGSVTLN